MSTSWQRRRSELNHDWLKNRYLPAIAKWINILDDYVEEPGFEKDFLEVTLPQWEEHRLLVIALIESFEIEMSPGIQLSHSPLSSLPESTKMWLRPLISALWMNRYPIADWKAAVLACVGSAEDDYHLLQKLVQGKPVLDIVQLRSYRKEFAIFQSHCQSLAKTIEALPSTCLVC